MHSSWGEEGEDVTKVCKGELQGVIPEGLSQWGAVSALPMAHQPGYVAACSLTQHVAMLIPCMAHCQANQVFSLYLCT